MQRHCDRTSERPDTAMNICHGDTGRIANDRGTRLLSRERLARDDREL